MRLRVLAYDMCPLENTFILPLSFHTVFIFSCHDLHKRNDRLLKFDCHEYHVELRISQSALHTLKSFTPVCRLQRMFDANMTLICLSLVDVCCNIIVIISDLQPPRKSRVYVTLRYASIHRASDFFNARQYYKILSDAIIVSDYWIHPLRSPLES